MGLKVQKSLTLKEMRVIEWLGNVVFVVRPHNEDNNDHSEEERNWKEGVNKINLG
jgi:hypothetical protein